jgi:hypothetical protein
MCLLIFILLAYLGFSALMIWLFPAWFSYPVVVGLGLVLAFVIWKVRSFFKGIKKELVTAGLAPEKKQHTLKAGERFAGQGVEFSFPVACDIEETRIQDFQCLMIKPRFTFAQAPKDTLLVVSSFKKEELLERLGETTEKLMAQLPEDREEMTEPASLGLLRGERRKLRASKDGRTVCAEVVCVGNDTGSVVWVAVAPEEDIQLLDDAYRELALRVQPAGASQSVKG